MNYWVVSPNLGDPSERDLDAWIKFVQRRKVAVMGWDTDHPLGRTFVENIKPGDFILVASGSNAYKQLCVAGIAVGKAETDLGEESPTDYSSFWNLDPAVILDRNPETYGISFNDAVYGKSQQIPAIYQLYPEHTPADRKIVLKLFELLGKNAPDLKTMETDETDEITRLIDEFNSTFLKTGDGEYHRNLIIQSRDEGKRNYKNILQLQRDGKDITDAVLYGLLPHADTEMNRKNNRWVHIASAITGNLRQWFENAGWTKSSEWPSISQKILSFIQSAIEHPESFTTLCADFEQTFPHKGFQVGMLSPVLSVLAPEHYVVVNRKPIAVINWLTGSTFGARITEMPAITLTIKQWVDENRNLLEPITLPDLTVYDTFDIFCHWLKAVKKHTLKQPVTKESRYKRFGRGNPDSVEKVLLKIFSDDSNRSAAIQFLYECIIRAHTNNTNNWEITLGPRSISLNVGFCRIFKFHINELSFFVLGTAFPAALREKYTDIVFFDEKPFKSIEDEVGKFVIAPEKLSSIISDIKYSVFEFIDLSGSRSKSSIWASSHSPGVLEYIRNITGKDVPSPDYEELLSEENDEETVDEVTEEEVITDEKERFETSEPYTMEQLFEETGFKKELLQYWIAAIDRKMQAVFYGPPGTGKTFLTQRIARYITGGTEGFVEFIQFHPAYTYEEFMQGIRPDTDKNGTIRFEMKPGRFLEFCKEAKKRNGPCVLIIDEINRANLSRVFGELMFLLEYREEKIPLAGGKRFSIPENVRIIGTMNTADRSIALVDFALRRRFAFLELKPEYDILLDFHTRNSFNASGLVSVLKEINAKINDKNYHLGISFFMEINLPDTIQAIWQMEIETYLEEYFFCQSEVMSDFIWNAVKDRILP